MEEGLTVFPPPAILEPASRPSSASTTASQKDQLPGISSIATAPAAATRSPQMRAATSAPTMTQYSTPASAPATANVGPGSNLPTCQNCQTSTTPLWRRDESGAVLCNACGLFLKLHGRPRPISLKTDVIKSRNRVKTMRPGMEMKKKNQPVAPDGNVADIQAQNAAAAALNASVRRPNQRPGNGHIDDTNSPISRTTTPNMYANHMLYHGLDEHHLQQPLGGLGLGGPGNGHGHSPLSGEGVPQTQEELLALNSGLKTRVDELEVINDLIQRRLQHYEVYGTGQPAGGLVEGGHDADAQLRAQVDALTASEAHLRSQLDESHRRENNLKRRLDEMELELKDARESLEAYEGGRAKKPRVEAPLHGEEDIKVEAFGAPATDVSAEVSAEVPVDVSMDEHFGGPIDATTEVPPEVSVDEQVSALADAQVNPPIDSAIDASSNAPINGPVDAPADAPVDAPVDIPIDSQLEGHTDAPVELHNDAANHAAVDVPVDPSVVEGPVDATVEAATEMPSEAPTDAPVASAEDTADAPTGETQDDAPMLDEALQVTA